MLYTQSNDLFLTAEPPKGYLEWNGAAAIEGSRQGTIFIQLKQVQEAFTSKAVQPVKPVTCTVIQTTPKGIIITVVLIIYY